jgi:2-octaprenyl-6-methoxyphenol hydroxylase
MAADYSARMADKRIRTDVVIAGAGVAGGTMAALLSQAGIRTICIDQDSAAKTLSPDFDGRTMAISYGSASILKRTPIWNSIAEQACHIKDIHITEESSPTLLRFLCDEVDAEAFGWVVEMRILRKAVYDALNDTKGCTYTAPARITNYKVHADHVETYLEDGHIIQSSLAIGADGRKSFTRDFMGIETRGRDYHQRAIVCYITHTKDHENTAIENFRQSGPLAILPMKDNEKGQHRSTLVWTEENTKATSAKDWDDATFAAALAERVSDVLGDITSIGPRFSYPLSLSHAQSYTGPRMALIADAAHGIHPIAGQGLNLGLRDVDVLSNLLIMAKNENADLGSADILQTYSRKRRADNVLMAGATDMLNQLFSNDIAPIRYARRLGLRAVKKIPSLQKLLMEQAMGKSILK